MNDKVEPKYWMTEESVRRMMRGGNCNGTVPVHAKPSQASKVPLYDQSTVDALMAEIERQKKRAAEAAPCGRVSPASREWLWPNEGQGIHGEADATPVEDPSQAEGNEGANDQYVLEAIAYFNGLNTSAAKRMAAAIAHLSGEADELADELGRSAARAEIAQAQAGKYLRALRIASMALAHASKSDPIYLDAYRHVSHEIAVASLVGRV